MRHRLSFFIHVHRSGRASVVARLTSPAFRKVDCSVGPLVGDWDRDRQRAKAASREAANLNLRLAEIERGVEAFFTRADLDGRQPAREEAARALRELCGSQRVEEVIPKCDLISTHTARRTFVVTALTLGVPAEVVMRWTGHADWASIRPYVAIVDELKKKEMGRFDGI